MEIPDFPLSTGDRVRGVVFGHAVGDAMGLGTEFLSKKEVQACYPGGLHFLDQIRRDSHRSRWKSGSWTDDTDQMLCILDSLLERGCVDITDIAARIHGWALSGGMGIGRTVAEVIYSPGFLRNPWAAAERAWIASGRRAAANGGVMRTSILGAWRWGHPEEIRKNAGDVCRITHWDPRCVASCVVVCLAVSALLGGSDDRSSMAESLAAEAGGYDPEVREAMERAYGGNIGDLDLGDPTSIGYTLKALSAGIWALLHPLDFREGILAVIHEGGDADSNAAVAGAVLGARFGFSGIPKEWSEGLLRGGELHSRVDRLLLLLQEQPR